MKTTTRIREMNVSVKLNADEEVMMNTLLQMKPKFRKRKELVLGSTTHLLSEPGTHKVQGIETFNTPPSDVGEEMTQQMRHYTAMLKKLVETSGDGRLTVRTTKI